MHCRFSRNTDRMKWLLSALIVFSLTSSNLSLMSFENQLLNENWLLIESKSKGNLHQFTSRSADAKRENVKTCLIFKENGVLIERNDLNTTKPFSISDWRFIEEGNKQFLKISNSRHWNGRYVIDQLDKYHLSLIRK